MLKIKDNVDLKELEKFGFNYHDKENASICYYRLIPMPHRTINIMIEIFKDKTIHYQLPIDCKIDDYINLEDYIQDLIQAGLVEKVGDIDEK